MLINEEKKKTIKQYITRTDNGMPDILKFFADLNNYEVKTPVEIANKVLDLLPKEIWLDKNVKFLDPCVKSGVFLREIICRLNIGLKKQIPNLYKRICHILKNQVYGIALEELGGIIARKTVYCSKKANDKERSIAILKPDPEIPDDAKKADPKTWHNKQPTIFKTEQGNILYKSCDHEFDKHGKCKYCGANKESFGKEKRIKKETHAYQFIHTESPKKIFNMQFDVIIGNPPYQLSDKSSEDKKDSKNKASAIAIYHKFVMQALKLNPKYLSMIIPARWTSGGRGEGLEEFRKIMWESKRLSIMHIFNESKDVFPNTSIAGGIMYFLIDNTKKHEKIKWITHDVGNKAIKETETSFSSNKKLIRDPEVKKIVEKIWMNLNKDKDSFQNIVFGRNPYNIRSNFTNFSKVKIKNGFLLFYNNGNKVDKGYLPKNFKFTKNNGLQNEYKILISKTIRTYLSHPDQVNNYVNYLEKIFISPPKTVSTETYLLIKPKESSKNICENIKSYMKTKFFFFLLSSAKASHNTANGDFLYVPLQDFTKKWNDQILFDKYKLTNEEIALINKYAPSKYEN